MPFSELVKSFEKIRSYMREFYVYGFRTRNDFSGKSGRTYDNERRRLECVLGGYTASARDSRGKNVFLSNRQPQRNKSGDKGASQEFSGAVSARAARSC